MATRLPKNSPASLFATVARQNFVRGDEDDNTLTGTSSRDSLYSFGGDDRLFGLGGDDTLRGGSGADYMDGGAGHDTVSYYESTERVIVDLANRQANTGDAAGDRFVRIERVFGTDYNDSLRGDTSDDSLWGSFGNDRLYGRAGDDTLVGGGGDDLIYGDRGDDQIAGGNGDDTIRAGDGDDYVESGEGDDSVYGGSGRDRIFARSGADLIYGGAGDDMLRDEGGSVLYIGIDDTVPTLAEADHYDGGSGYDTLTYGLRPVGASITLDLMILSRNTGEALGDTYVSIEAFAGVDTAYGSHGADNLSASEYLHGRGGDDVLTATSQAEIYGGGGDDILFGSSEDDVLSGGGGSDVIDGGAGADRFIAGAGDNIFIGGYRTDEMPDAELDMVDYSASASRIVADLQNQSMNRGNADGDTYIAIEALRGTRFGDSLRGDDGDNTLDGRGGDDLLYGRGGDDTLNGGAGDDVLVAGEGRDFLFGGAGQDTLHIGLGSTSMTGGNGSDRFVINQSNGLHTVMDFENDIDVLELRLFGSLDIVRVGPTVGGVPGTLMNTGGALVYVNGISPEDLVDDIEFDGTLIIVDSRGQTVSIHDDPLENDPMAMPVVDDFVFIA